jgi:hypothetical protein
LVVGSFLAVAFVGYRWIAKCCKSPEEEVHDKNEAQVRKGSNEDEKEDETEEEKGGY